MVAVAHVEVRWANVDDLTDDHLGLLDHQERARWRRLLRPDDQARFALGAILVRSLVAEREGTNPGQVVLDRTCPMCGEGHGPVTAVGLDWRCSVSHSGPFAMAAVAPLRSVSLVGVDVETRCPPDWRELLPRVLAAGETAPASEQEFVDMWVRKEASVKASGEGLSRSMTSISLESDGTARIGSDGPTVRLVDVDVGARASLVEAVGGSAHLAAAVAVGPEPAHVTWARARL